MSLGEYKLCEAHKNRSADGRAGPLVKKELENVQMIRVKGECVKIIHMEKKTNLIY